VRPAPSEAVKSVEITGNGSRCSYLGANASDQVRVLIAYRKDYDPGRVHLGSAQGIFGNVMEQQ